MDDQSFEFLSNNFARLTNIISEQCPTFALFKSVYRLHLLYVVLKLTRVESQGFAKFSNSCVLLKITSKRGYIKISIGFITV